MSASAKRGNTAKMNRIHERPTINTNINTRQWRWQTPYKHPQHLSRNFNTTRYAVNKRLPVFKRGEINSPRNDGGFYFPNARNAERKHRGLVEAIDYYDSRGDPKRGDKLIYVELSGPTTDVTVNRAPSDSYIEVTRDYDGRLFILPINEYGIQYILYKRPIMPFRNQKNRENALRKGPFGRRSRLFGGRTRKQRKQRK